MWNCNQSQVKEDSSSCRPKIECHNSSQPKFMSYYDNSVSDSIAQLKCKQFRAFERTDDSEVVRPNVSPYESCVYSKLKPSSSKSLKGKLVKNESNFKMKLKLCGSNSNVSSAKNATDLSNNYDTNKSKELNLSRQVKTLLDESSKYCHDLTSESRGSKKCKKAASKTHKRINYKTFMDYLDKPIKDFVQGVEAYSQSKCTFILPLCFVFALIAA